MNYSGNILKMKSQLATPVNYSLPIGDQLISMNQFLGKKLSLKFSGKINCIATGEEIKKSYNQGYSYKSFISLAQCDVCMVQPEKCHYDQGTCREPDWGKQHCLISHTIYLANSSGLKVGITRQSNIPTRWIDQGASQVLPILKVSERKIAGLIEVEIKRKMSDRTDYRKMLKNEIQAIDLEMIRDEVFEEFGEVIDDFDAEDVYEPVLDIQYPVLEYPKKIVNLSFDKDPNVEGILLGIKGQYLIFDTGVINIRKYQGYFIDFSF